MPGVAQGDRIRSQDVTAIMRRINALENITLERGNAFKTSTFYTTPGGYIHVNNLSTDMRIITTQGAPVAIYDLQGWSGDHNHEFMLGFGPNGDFWTYAGTKNTVPTPDEFDVSLNRYNEATGAFLSRIDCDVFDTTDVPSEPLILAYIGGSSGNKIWLRVGDASWGKWFKHSLSGTRQSALFINNPALAASKETADYYILKLSPGASWKEYNDTDTLQSTLDSNVDSLSDSGGADVFQFQSEDGSRVWIASGGTNLETTTSAGVETANWNPSELIAINCVQMDAAGGDDEVFACGNLTDIEVYDASNGAHLRTITLYDYSTYSPGQTTFYKYPTAAIGDKVSLGTPDNGVSIPALAALEGVIQRGNEVADMQSAVEAVLVNWKNGITDQAFNWDGKQEKTITDATNASPIVITTSGAHGYPTGYGVTVSAVLGNFAANGDWVITNLTSTTFSLDGSTGTGAYGSGGKSVNPNNLYHVAVESGKYDWDETGTYKDIVREDLIDELDLCLTKLEGSNLV